MSVTRTGNTGRDIVIGDVHGCLDELDELMIALQLQEADRLVFVGDLVDRGPDSVGVIRRVQELRAACVMGNHDEWYVRCAKHETRRRQTGEKNPLAMSTKFALYNRLDAADIMWLAELPYLHRIDARTVVVHAGLRPGVTVEAQERRDMLRMRYLRRATGEMWNMKSDELLTPDVAAFWTEVWTGPEDVIYGHHPSKSGTVRTENAGAVCWGIDTGCCFGNKLTAWVREPGGLVELASVPARAQYATWHESMGDA